MFAPWRNQWHFQIPWDLRGLDKMSYRKYLNRGIWRKGIHSWTIFCDKDLSLDNFIKDSMYSDIFLSYHYYFYLSSHYWKPIVVSSIFSLAIRLGSGNDQVTKVGRPTLVPFTTLDLFYPGVWKICRPSFHSFYLFK